MVKKVKESGLVLTDILPRYKKDKKEFSLYQKNKILTALGLKKPSRAGFTVLESDNSENFAKAGFYTKDNYVFFPDKHLKVKQIYKSEGALSYYSGNIFCGTARTVIMPLAELPNYLTKAIERENSPDYKKFYDFISVREGEYNLHYADSTFEFMKGFNGESHESLLEYLTQYKRHGLLGKNQNGGKWFGENFQLVYVKCGEYLE